MRIQELSDLTGVPVRTIHWWVHEGHVPPPHGGRKYATYTHDHLEAIRAYLALKHNNTVMKEVAVFIKEEGITLVEYLKAREDTIRYHGLGVA